MYNDCVECGIPLHVTDSVNCKHCKGCFCEDCVNDKGVCLICDFYNHEDKVT